MEVSLNIAKTLKKAGFKDPVSKCYDGSEMLCSYSIDMKNYNIGGGKNISAPTYQQAIDWLYERFNIWISINISIHGFFANIYKKEYDEIKVLGQEVYFEKQYQAQEAGIKLALNKVC